MNKVRNTFRVNSLFTLCFIFISLFLIGDVQSCFSQDAVSDTLSLNGKWSFKIDPNNVGLEQRWYDPSTDFSGWDSLEVPGNWDLKNEYAHYSGLAWYRIEWNIPSTWVGKEVRIFFEGVNHFSKVWLNGTLLGENNLGFLPFTYDVTPYLNSSGSNSLVVCVDNTFKRGAIWNWGGIRRPVYAFALPSAYIKNVRVKSELDLEKKSAEVSFEVKLDNQSKVPEQLLGKLRLSGPDGFIEILPFEKTIEGSTEQSIVVSTKIRGKSFHLWDFDHPNLYRVEVELKNSKDEIHRYTCRFGLRKIEVDSKLFQIRLNGDPIRMMGFNLVPDDRTTGSTLPLWRVKEDIDLMKSFGANMTRLSHLPMHTEMLDYLDEKGMLVFEEIPLWGYDPLVNKDNKVPFEWLSRMINNHFNHPSIIGWGVGNEIGYVPGVMEYVDSSIRYVKKIDPSRLAVMVNHTADQGKDDPIRFSDVGLINKYGRAIGSLADRIHFFHPDKVLFYAEFGYGQSGENLDTDVNAKAMLDSIRFKPYLVGASLWTFNDYRSNYNGTKELSENRAWGIVDVFRQKKKSYFSFKREYNPLKEVSVHFKEKVGKLDFSVELVPRSLLDLPAFPLKDYLLVAKVFRSDGSLATGKYFSLPKIFPGEDAQRFIFSLPNGAGASSLHLSVLSPLHYAVYDTVIFLTAPDAPIVHSIKGVRTEMNDVGYGSGAIQIFMDKPPSSVEYRAMYKRGDLVKQTDPTRNPYIEINGLSFGEEYEVSVKALNDFGESVSTPTRTVMIKKELSAPLVSYIEPADGGFFVGFKSLPEDYIHVIEYTTVTGEYTPVKSIQSATKGLLFVPNLQNGQRYFFRMRSIRQNNAYSEWTQEFQVIPDGGQPPAVPKINGIIRGQIDALVAFEPVRKATGYTIEYKGTKSEVWQSVSVSAAQLHDFLIRGLKKNEGYFFRMKSHNQYGSSSWSEIVSQ